MDEEKNEYETPYSHLSNAKLYSLFSDKTWSSIGPEHRKNACQEVENREAELRGATPRRVTLGTMNGACFGYQSGNTICLNSELITNNRFRIAEVDIDKKQTGTYEYVSIPAPGWNMLDTVFHEDTHGRQEDEKGDTHQTGLSYFQSCSEKNPHSDAFDWYVYRLQPSERDAFETGQKKTAAAIELVRAEELDVSGASEYYQDIESQKTSLALQQARVTYDDPRIDQTIYQVVQDRERGIIRDNPTKSYQHISSMLDEQHRETLMEQTSEDDTEEESDAAGEDTSNDTEGSMSCTDESAMPEGSVGDQRTDAEVTYGSLDDGPTIRFADDELESADEAEDGSELNGTVETEEEDSALDGSVDMGADDSATSSELDDNIDFNDVPVNECSNAESSPQLSDERVDLESDGLIPDDSDAENSEAVSDDGIDSELGGIETDGAYEPTDGIESDDAGAEVDLASSDDGGIDVEMDS